jgi:diguanylate cyclase (GGDEF)-like protein
VASYPGVIVDVGLQRARSILSATAQLIVQHQGVPLGRVTTSIGLAVLPDHGTTATALLETADAALYRAKQEGRNRVCTAAGPALPSGSAESPPGR